eukprot:TRINITY_DN20851_c0_g1_i1.p1 TRINITY_DN20851_c0_g1~~TRINITY_DN20851_c0_g1_i1.p1  ORF type:complete len:524 (-),score=114.68 TRINITY_DN20851_c0_g1_i1:37-1608(-)
MERLLCEPRACPFCIHNRRRCEQLGVRPCLQCQRQGREAECIADGKILKMACFPCKISKLSCDKKKPTCGRCERKNKHCLPFIPAAAASSDEGSGMQSSVSCTSTAAPITTKFEVEAAAGDSSGCAPVPTILATPLTKSEESKSLFPAAFNEDATFNQDMPLFMKGLCQNRSSVASSPSSSAAADPFITNSQVQPQMRVRAVNWTETRNIRVEFCLEPSNSKGGWVDQPISSATDSCLILEEPVSCWDFVSAASRAQDIIFNVSPLQMMDAVNVPSKYLTFRLMTICQIFPKDVATTLFDKIILVIEDSLQLSDNSPQLLWNLRSLTNSCLEWSSHDSMASAFDIFSLKAQSDLGLTSVEQHWVSEVERDLRVLWEAHYPSIAMDEPAMMLNKIDNATCCLKTFANQKAEILLGYSAEELLKLSHLREVRDRIWMCSNPNSVAGKLVKGFSCHMSEKSRLQYVTVQFRNLLEGKFINNGLMEIKHKRGALVRFLYSGTLVFHPTTGEFLMSLMIFSPLPGQTN